MPSMKQCPKLRAIAFSIIALVFGFMSGLNTNNSLSIGVEKTTTESKTCDTVVSEDHNHDLHQRPQQDCTTRLDALDATFNERRRMRVIRAARQQLTPNPVRFFDMFEPEAVCFTEERFGSVARYNAFGDGPKFICGLDYLQKTTTTTTTTTTATTPGSNNGDNRCLAYSVGSNNQIAFEQAVRQFLPGCETHTFDPTLYKPFVGNAFSEFHPWGLGEDNVNVTFWGKSFITKSFKTVIQELGHEGRRIHILKIDCEGCEYTVMEPLFDAIARDEVQVDQILIEMHNEPKWVETPEVRWTRIVKWFEAADRAKMRIYHKERNHWGCQGYTCVEYALASEDFLRRSNGQIVCGDDYQ